MRSLLVVACLSLSLTAGCEHDEHDEHENHDGHDSSESSELEADEYSEGMVKECDGGHFSVALSSEPGPPAKGVNTWMLEVSDHSGAAAPGATLTVTPTMPEHGHGSQSVAEVTDDGEGQYTVTPVDLHMAGLWDVEISIEAGETTDEVHFVFEIVES